MGMLLKFSFLSTLVLGGLAAGDDEKKEPEKPKGFEDLCGGVQSHIASFLTPADMARASHACVSKDMNRACKPKWAEAFTVSLQQHPDAGIAFNSLMGRLICHGPDHVYVRHSKNDEEGYPIYSCACGLSGTLFYHPRGIHRD